MTHQDKDREAFEAAVLERFPHLGLNFDQLHDESYDDEEMQSAWEGWQAARDRYAPRVTERETVDNAAAAIYEANRERNWPGNFQDAHAAIRISIMTAAKVALRAAGVRFEEEV